MPLELPITFALTRGMGHPIPGELRDPRGKQRRGESFHVACLYMMGLRHLPDSPNPVFKRIDA